MTCRGGSLRCAPPWGSRVPAPSLLGPAVKCHCRPKKSPQPLLFVTTSRLRDEEMSHFSNSSGRQTLRGPPRVCLQLFPWPAHVAAGAVRPACLVGLCFFLYFPLVFPAYLFCWGSLLEGQLWTSAIRGVCVLVLLVEGDAGERRVVTGTTGSDRWWWAGLQRKDAPSP